MHNWWNIRLAGKTKSIPENNTMWSVLTTASTNPIVELDFLGSDAHELLGFAEQAKFAGLQTGTPPVLTHRLQTKLTACRHYRLAHMLCRLVGHWLVTDLTD